MQILKLFVVLSTIYFYIHIFINFNGKKCCLYAFVYIMSFCFYVVLNILSICKIVYISLEKQASLANFHVLVIVITKVITY